MEDKINGGWIGAIIACIGAVLTLGRMRQRVDDINEIKTAVREMSRKVQDVSERLARIEGKLGEQ